MAPRNINDGLAVPGVLHASSGSQLEFQLGSPINLSQIDIFTLADKNRTAIFIDIEVSSDGGANYSLLAAPRLDDWSQGTSQDREYRAASLTDDTGILAPGINAIRFTILDGPSPDPESGYAEIDVYGAIPEPGTFALAALGLLGLLGFIVHSSASCGVSKGKASSISMRSPPPRSTERTPAASSGVMDLN